MTDRRVVVTGVGTVNASTVGGRDALASALALGRSAIGPIRAFDAADLTSRLAAEVDEATVASLVDRDAARRLSRICRLTLGACLLAVGDARRSRAAPGSAPWSAPSMATSPRAVTSRRASCVTGRPGSRR